MQVLGVDTGIKFDPGAEIDGYKFDCKAAVGYLAVYRLKSIYSALFLYHLFFVVVVFISKTSDVYKTC